LLETSSGDRWCSSSAVIDALIDHRIEIRTKQSGADPRRTGRDFGDGYSGHESARPNGLQFGDG
jgi:hypothetical protein